jgi:hypothetical protein
MPPNEFLSSLSRFRLFCPSLLKAIVVSWLTISAPCLMVRFDRLFLLNGNPSFSPVGIVFTLLWTICKKKMEQLKKKWKNKIPGFA